MPGAGTQPHRDPDTTFIKPETGSEIDVEFVVLHYTAETLDDTLAIFAEPEPRAGAHLVVAEDGRFFEVFPCWDGRTVRAPHAGRSRWNDGSREWESFNDFAIGIEIVSPNGNVLDYTDAQYRALGTILRHLSNLYPSLGHPSRVVGHEQIAGWRGKVDPGAKFDWVRLFADAYPGKEPPRRESAVPADLVEALARFRRAAPRDEGENAEYWRAVNYVLEKFIAALNQG